MLHRYGRLVPSLQYQIQSISYRPSSNIGYARNKVNTHLSLRRLNSAVSLTRRNRVSLAEELEVVDQALHALLHHGTGWRCELMVVDLDNTSRHLVQALADDVQTLAHLLDTAEVSVVAIAIFADGDIELDLSNRSVMWQITLRSHTHLVVLVIRLDLSEIPRDTTSTQHDTAEAPVQGLLGSHYTNTNRPLLPDTVASNDLLNLVDTAAELSCPLEDIIKEAMGKVEGNTTRADVGGVEAGAGDALVELHELLALFEAPQEGGKTTNVHDVSEDGHEIYGVG